MHLIGLDIGTTGCKAVVFDPEGQIRGHASCAYEVICSEPGMGEQDAERVWQLTCQALGQAVAASGSTESAALSLSVQGDAVIPVDRDWRPLHPAILGMDYRSQPQAAWCARTCGAFELFQQTGMRPHPMNSLAKILWLRENRPEVFRQAFRMMTYGDWILARLGAEPAIDETMASRTMAFDLARRKWSPEILNAVGLSESLLSRPVPPGTPVGSLHPSLAAELGLPRGLPVVAGAHDQTCAALGSGAVRQRLGVISTGTAEVLSTAFEAPVLTRKMFNSFYPCYRHARPGMFFTFALNHVGGILLQWYRDNFGAADAEAARRHQRSAYEWMDSQMPDGPSPVMVLPHFNGSGTPWCDLDAKGAILGLTLATTRHDIAKAILEGLTFELSINLQTMLEAGLAIDEFVAVGGGARSRRWLQIKADVLGRPIRTVRCPESACLGAALLAGTAQGVYSTLEEAVSRTVVYEAEFLPHDSRARAYQERADLYRRLYPALKAIR